MNFRTKRNYLRALSIACTALAAGALSTISSLASARNTEEVTETVRYKDLSMESPADRAELRERIGRAARRVCTVAARNDRPVLSSYKNCRERALKDALAKLGIEDDAFAPARSGDDR